MIEEKFASGTSLIHGLDPKTRILASIVLSFATALCDHLYLAGIYFFTDLEIRFSLPPKWALYVSSGKQENRKTRA